VVDFAFWLWLGYVAPSAVKSKVMVANQLIRVHSRGFVAEKVWRTNHARDPVPLQPKKPSGLSAEG
jgi:hypothetical protein